MFDWNNALLCLVIFGVPVSMVGFLIALTEESAWLVTLFTILFFVLVFIGGGLPDEVWG